MCRTFKVGLAVAAAVLLAFPARASDDALYRGTYTCAQGTTKLALGLSKPDAKGRRNAVFAFGPLPSSPHVRAGAFMMRGRVDMDGGEVRLSPGAWVVRPRGSVSIALAGQALELGEILKGRALGPRCTDFLLYRIR